ncbi:hypothetical protein EKN56_03075 [Limnobaculum zhutongyuii]|uniref:Uncharacterized protein n=1 Tax=Limnobaculum zhutongyuii TaxID=2498113 RepID=A0A411WHB7_9GAMM|nr:hypothetical protein [Limnobaculum zhutongyuii]QBH95476.1 hypothetical protein EKN56_03075 [Limnobaculum zhutongyuii]TQS88835.1 hypothetical protein ELQ32_09520 [Limnobaculum zhutongyuii]
MSKAKKSKRLTSRSTATELEELRSISAQLNRIENRIDAIHPASVKSGAIAGAVAGGMSGGLVYAAIEIIKTILKV